MDEVDGVLGTEESVAGGRHRLLRWLWRARSGALDAGTLEEVAGLAGASLREVFDLEGCVEALRRAEESETLAAVFVEGRIPESDLIRLCRALRKGDELVPVVLSIPGGPAALARLALTEGACDVLLSERADPDLVLRSLRLAFETAARQSAERLATARAQELAERSAAEAELLTWAARGRGLSAWLAATRTAAGAAGGLLLPLEMLPAEEGPGLPHCEADAVVASCDGALRAILGPEVEAEVRCEAPGVLLAVAPETVALVLLNLAVSSRDRLEGRGLLRVGTRAAGGWWRVEVEERRRGWWNAVARFRPASSLTARGSGGGEAGLRLVRGLVDLAGGSVSSRPTAGGLVSTVAALPSAVRATAS